MGGGTQDQTKTASLKRRKEHRPTDPSVCCVQFNQEPVRRNDVMSRMRFIGMLCGFFAIGTAFGVLIVPASGSAQVEGCIEERQCIEIIKSCEYHPFWGCEYTGTVDGCVTYYDGC